MISVLTGRSACEPTVSVRITVRPSPTFTFPAAHRQRLRTVNGRERLNQEIRRRTRVVGIFPNEASCLRLVSALAMETSDDWETGKRYLSLIS